MKNTIVYGLHAVRALLKSKREVLALYVQSHPNDRLSALIALAKQKKIPIHIVEKQDLDAKTQGVHQGICASVLASESHKADLESFLDEINEPILLLVLDTITDPHNLGACLRSANAFGVHAVIAPKDKAVSITPVVSKVACGAAELTPFFQVTNLARTLRMLQERNIWIVGTTAEASESISDIDMKGSIAIVMGAEGSGMRRLTQEHCDHLAFIPMLGSVESLNVSVATGVCLYEAVRQRSMDQ